MTSRSIAAAIPSVERKPGQLSLSQQQRLWGWIFLSPWIVGFLVFNAFPMAASLIFSFTDYQIGKPIHWVGLANWQKLFSDPVTLHSLTITIRFAGAMLPISVVFPLAVTALVTSKHLIAKPFFRTFFFMPYMIPAISAIFGWQIFLNGQTGTLNRLLRLIGINEPPNWLTDPKAVTVALVMIGLWGLGNAMLTLMIAKEGVQTQLYEAAKVDGADHYRTFYHITLPMISPILFYNLVLTAIGLMQYFIVPYVLSNGVDRSNNPDVYFINFHLYREMFQFGDMGYASVIAWFLFAIGLVLTIALFISSRRWVYYTNAE